jgi:hypothetical protein
MHFRRGTFHLLFKSSSLLKKTDLLSQLTGEQIQYGNQFLKDFTSCHFDIHAHNQIVFLITINFNQYFLSNETLPLEIIAINQQTIFKLENEIANLTQENTDLKLENSCFKQAIETMQKKKMKRKQKFKNEKLNFESHEKEFISQVENDKLESLQKESKDEKLRFEKEKEEFLQQEIERRI